MNKGFKMDVVMLGYKILLFEACKTPRKTIIYNYVLVVIHFAAIVVHQWAPLLLKAKASSSLFLQFFSPHPHLHVYTPKKTQISHFSHHNLSLDLHRSSVQIFPKFPNPKPKSAHNFLPLAWISFSLARDRSKTLQF